MLYVPDLRYALTLALIFHIAPMSPGEAIAPPSPPAPPVEDSVPRLRSQVAVVVATERTSTRCTVKPVPAVTEMKLPTKLGPTGLRALVNLVFVVASITMSVNVSAAELPRE